MKSFRHPVIALLLALAFAGQSHAIVFDLADNSGVEDATFTYDGNEMRFEGVYTGQGKITRVTIELADDPIENTITTYDLPKQNWSFTQTESEVVYRAPQDPEDAHGVVELLEASSSDASYTFSSDFAADHGLAGGVESIMATLFALPEGIDGFYNAANTLYFEEDVITVTLRAKHGNTLTDIVMDVPAYKVTAVPEPASFSVLLSLVASLSLVRRRGKQ